MLELMGENGEDREAVEQVRSQIGMGPVTYVWDFNFLGDEEPQGNRIRTAF